MVRLRRWLRLWFSLQEPVATRTYLVHGVGLMAFKYAVDALAVGMVLGRFWSPSDYLIPSLLFRQATLNVSPNWLIWGMVVWTLPFIWIGASMTLRRALDAGLSAWLCLLFFVPVGNYALMVALAALPSKRPLPWPSGEPAPVVQDRVRSAFLGIAAGGAVAVAMILFSVFALGGYGAALFLGAPFVLGVITAFIFNRGHPRRGRTTSGVVLLAVLVVSGALVLFALEGILCVAMAAPLALPIAWFGGFIGRAIALCTPRPAVHAWLLLFILPALASVESLDRTTLLHEVVSVVEIDAPPETVWHHVVSFSELTEPPRWLFRLGIAYPKRATIEGAGVGAVRYCEFSTGPFVEPITASEEPTRLSFGVSSQPPPMAEWSPYSRVFAPHLNGYFRARRGEFRLVRLPGARTRLEGSTWYELEMAPQLYWKTLADALVSRIHLRVLRHVKALAERGQ